MEGDSGSACLGATASTLRHHLTEPCYDWTGQRNMALTLTGNIESRVAIRPNSGLRCQGCLGALKLSRRSEAIAKKPGRVG